MTIIAGATPEKLILKDVLDWPYLSQTDHSYSVATSTDL